MLVDDFQKLIDHDDLLSKENKFKLHEYANFYDSLYDNEPDNEAEIPLEPYTIDIAELLTSEENIRTFNYLRYAMRITQDTYDNDVPNKARDAWLRLRDTANALNDTDDLYFNEHCDSIDNFVEAAHAWERAYILHEILSSDVTHSE